MSGVVDLIRNERARENPGKPQIAHGRVVRAPANVGDMMWVQLIGWSSHHAYEIPGSHWDAKWKFVGGADADWVADLPVHGDPCCVIFDHMGDGWVGSLWGHA